MGMWVGRVFKKYYHFAVARASFFAECYNVHAEGISWRLIASMISMFFPPSTLTAAFAKQLRMSQCGDGLMWPAWPVPRFQSIDGFWPRAPNSHWAALGTLVRLLPVAAAIETVPH